MQQSILEKVRSIPQFWWILLAALAAGIFLRSYNHHDWLRFNADQGRDAALVSNVVSGAARWPLLGPQAGGTNFKLGPAFYYFEIASARIFGNYPDKMAYPDLFTSVLAIPLLFFFLLKFFDKYTALSLGAIFAVSEYAIGYARFAWNPNSTPFWTILFLYALQETVAGKSKRKFFWALTTGIALGVGVQLHTTLLVILPLTTLAVCAYFCYKNLKLLKYCLVVLALSLLVNAPQLVSEYRTKGENLKAFFAGVKTKENAEGSALANGARGNSCWIQGNVYIISGYEISDKCSYDPGKNARDDIALLFGAVFVAGGTILGLRYFLKEADAGRKSFLGIVAVFTAISYLIFLKMAFELSVRFYLALIFLPFFLLGFWMRFFREKFAVRPNLILLILCVPLIFSNLFFVQKSFIALANYGKEGGGDADVLILKEAEVFSQFIIGNSDKAKEVYIDGDGKFLFKGYKPIRYLVGRSNINLLLADKAAQMPSRYFYIASSGKKEKMLQSESIEITRLETFGKFSILLVNKITD